MTTFPKCTLVTQVLTGQLRAEVWQTELQGQGFAERQFRKMELYTPHILEPEKMSPGGDLTWR